MNTHNTTHTMDSIMQRIHHALHPQQLEVLDLSAQHKHHKQAPQGQGHYHVIISEECFPTKNRRLQHQHLYQCLEPLLNKCIHALKITVVTTPPSTI